MIKMPPYGGESQDISIESPFITMNNSEKMKYPFSTIIPVRITDINYGKHLVHVATVGIFHHARVLFLKENGFDEMNIDALGIILLNSHYSFKSEAKLNNLAN